MGIAREGRSARSKIESIVSRTLSVVPLGSAPAAAISPPARFPAVSSSRRRARRSSGIDGTRLLAVAPSGKLVSCQRWQSIFSRCDLPLPKNPLTHAPRWLVFPILSRKERMIFWTPSAYCPSQTNVSSSPRSSDCVRSLRLSEMRAWPWFTRGWEAGSRCRASLIFIAFLLRRAA